MKNIISKLYIKDKSFYKLVGSIALPIALQSMITTGVNMMDTIMVGSLGEIELSAVSLANQFIQIYHILCMGMGMGASVLVSRYYGMKNQEAMKKALAIMLRMCLGFAFLFCLTTIFIPSQIMMIYTYDEEIIRCGVRYLNWSVVTYFMLGLSLTSTVILRAISQVKIPLYTSIAAFFVNVGANYIFIFGKAGMPQMGVAGAAIGTLISRIFECSVICGYLFFKDTRIHFRIPDLWMKTGAITKEYFRISVPVLVSDAILALGNSAVTMVIGRLGSEFVAANAVTAVTQQLSTVVIQGVSQAASIVTGYALGENKPKKALRQGYALLGLGIVLGIISGALIIGISRPVISAYHLSESTAAIAMQLMTAISIILFFQATNNIMTKGALRGGGDTKMLMLTDNIFLWVFSIPLGILAGFVLHLPPFWIYVFLKIDQVVKAVWCVFRLRSGKWIKKISAEM